MSEHDENSQRDAGDETTPQPDEITNSDPESSTDSIEIEHDDGTKETIPAPSLSAEQVQAIEAEKVERMIKNLFTYRPLNENQISRVIDLNKDAEDLARLIFKHTPPGQSRNAAVANVVEAVRTAAAAISFDE